MKLKLIAVIGNYSDWISWRTAYFEPSLDIINITEETLISGSTKYIWIKNSKDVASTCEFIAMIITAKNYKDDYWQAVISYCRNRIRQ